MFISVCCGEYGSSSFLTLSCSCKLSSSTKALRTRAGGTLYTGFDYFTSFFEVSNDMDDPQATPSTEPEVQSNAEALAAKVLQEQELFKQRQEDFDKVKSEDLLKLLNSNLRDRNQHCLLLKAFVRKARFIRSDLESLANVVEASKSFKVHDSAIMTYHMQFLLCCGSSDKQLDNANHDWGPTKTYSFFDEFADLKEKVKQKFIEIYSNSS